MTEKDIKISAQPLTDQSVCIFTVDRPILEGGSYDCRSAELAAGSPLLEALFALGGIREIFVKGDSLTIAKTSDDPWQVLGKKIGAVIRERINSGEPLIVIETNRPSLTNEEIRKSINDLFEHEVNPALAMHGGYVELVDVQGNAVMVRMSGGCQGCGAASITLRHGIERAINGRFPEITEVIDVTDHESGDNPYY